MDEFKPKIVGLFCNCCSYRGADLAVTSRTKSPCSGACFWSCCGKLMGT